MKHRADIDSPDWDKELDQLLAISGPIPKSAIPPTPEDAAKTAQTKKPQKPSRPAYQPGGKQYDYVMEEKPRTHPSPRTWLLVLICVFAFILIVGTCALIFTGLFTGSKGSSDLILNNVIAAGTNIGGLNREQAEQKLAETAARQYETADMVVRIGDAVVALAPADTGAALDVSGVVDTALLYGHEGSKAEQDKAYAASLSENRTMNLLPWLQLDREYIRRTLEQQTADLGLEFQQSSYALEGQLPELALDRFDPEAACQTLVLNVGAPGIGVDIEALLTQILEAYGKGSFQVDARSSTSLLEPRTLDLDAIYEELYIAPNTESYGYEFDLQNAKGLLRTAQPGEVLRIPMLYVKPVSANVNSEFPDVLASCQTAHNANEYRNVNLQLACQALNGLVLQPGQELSFNSTVGERTKERGFLPAPAYRSDSIAAPVGGGIGQVASTLYYCAMLADLSVPKRFNEQFLPGYIEPGMDASVSLTGEDLVILNSTDRPVKIIAEYTDDSLNFQILGKDTKSYYVTMEYQMSTFRAETIYEDYNSDSGLADGAVLQSGNDGYFVQSYRCKYSKQTNELISREPEAGSSYPMNPNIVARVHQLPPTPETEPETEPPIPETEPPEPQLPEPQPEPEE